jgi:hypothetical protein
LASGSLAVEVVRRSDGASEVFWSGKLKACDDAAAVTPKGKRQTVVL